jgi:hypothetical protein
MWSRQSNMASSCSGLGPVAGCYEHGTDPPISIKASLHFTTSNSFASWRLAVQVHTSIMTAVVALSPRHSNTLHKCVVSERGHPCLIPHLIHLCVPVSLVLYLPFLCRLCRSRDSSVYIGTRLRAG